MANPFKHEVPTFVAGEPGFAAKLNQLGNALRETRELIIEISEEEVIEEVADGAEPAAEAAEEKPKAAPRGRKAAAK